MSLPRSPAPSPRWYLILVAGLVPICVGGFVLSAIANRVAFALWAIVFGFGFATVVRRAMDGDGRLHLAWIVLGLAAAVLAVLLVRHWEEVRLGMAVLAPLGDSP